MGVITVSVDDVSESKFRKYVMAKYGSKKGALGKAFSEAMDKWVNDRKDLRAFEELLNNGLNLQNSGYKKRSELYDRN